MDLGIKITWIRKDDNAERLALLHAEPAIWPFVVWTSGWAAHKGFDLNSFLWMQSPCQRHEEQRALIRLASCLHNTKEEKMVLEKVGSVNVFVFTASTPFSQVMCGQDWPDVFEHWSINLIFSCVINLFHFVFLYCCQMLVWVKMYETLGYNRLLVIPVGCFYGSSVCDWFGLMFWLKILDWTGHGTNSRKLWIEFNLI